MAAYKDCYNKVLSLPLEEFYMLAALGGLKQAYGFNYDINRFSVEEMLRILLHLADKKIISSVENRFECCAEYKEVLAYLKYSQKIIEIKSSISGCPVCICYLGKEILVTRKSSVNSKRLLIHTRLYEDFCDYIYSSGYIDALDSVSDERPECGTDAPAVYIKCIEISSNYVKSSIKIKKISGEIIIFYNCGGIETCSKFSREILEAYIENICETPPQ